MWFLPTYNHSSKQPQRAIGTQHCAQRHIQPMHQMPARMEPLHTSSSLRETSSPREHLCRVPCPLYSHNLISASHQLSSVASTAPQCGTRIRDQPQVLIGAAPTAKMHMHTHKYDCVLAGPHNMYQVLHGLHTTNCRLQVGNV